MQRESIDDVIDRVARTLTTPVQDAGLSARIRPRISDRRRPVPTVLLACGAVAAVLVVALVATTWRPVRPSPAAVAVVLPGRPFTAIGPLVGTVASTAPGITRERRTVALAATEHPMLEIESLTIDAIEEVQPLRVDDIRITDIASDMAIGGMREFK